MVTNQSHIIKHNIPLLPRPRPPCHCWLIYSSPVPHLLQLSREHEGRVTIGVNEDDLFSIISFYKMAHATAHFTFTCKAIESS